MRSVRLKLIFFVSLSLSAISASPRYALAAEPTPSEISVARRLFEEGKAAEDAGRWREAAEKFRRATAIKDTPGIRFHLARCEEEQGALVEALVEYERASELIERGAKAPDVERLLPDAREKVRARVAQLTLKLPDGVAEVRVELDGKAISPSVIGVALPVNPGAHRLTAVAAGRKPFAAEVTLAAGEGRQLLIDLAPGEVTLPSNAAPTTPAPRARDADSGISTRTMVLVGEGSLFVAALVTGVVFTVKRNGADERYEAANRIVLQQIAEPSGLDSACRMPLEGCAALAEAQDDRSEAGTVATASFVTAGVSAAAFGLTYWLWPQEAPPNVRVGAGPGRFGLSVTGRF